MHRARPQWRAATLLREAGCRAYWRTVGQPEGIVSEQDTDHHFVHRSTIPTMHFQASLPRLPIPKLEDTINRYLAAQKPLLNDEQYRHTEKLAREFENGMGKDLHRDLLEHDRNSKHTSYISDDVSPQDEIELSHCMLHGYGFNRWFDKSFSLIITSDGTAGVNFEHSWGDGVAVLRFINEVYRDSTEHPALLPDSSPALFVTSCDKLEFKLGRTITSAISAARTKFEEKRKKLLIRPVKYNKFGKKFVVSKKISPDAMFQLACQMAAYHQYGKFVPSYEACSTAAFKHGRTETIRPTSLYTKKCTNAFIDERGKYSIEEMKNMIDECSKYHRRLQLEATLGQGFDRHLFALKYLIQVKGGRMPDFYNDPACFAQPI